MNDSLILFAKRLKFLRNQRKLTLEKLSELVDMSPNHISKLEGARTNPSFPLISKLAYALNVEMKDLFDFDVEYEDAYVKKEFENLLKTSDTKYLRTLYKIHKELVYIRSCK